MKPDGLPHLGEITVVCAVLVVSPREHAARRVHVKQRQSNVSEGHEVDVGKRAVGDDVIYVSVAPVKLYSNENKT